jgi:exodeoxyribonuclease-5
MSAVTSVLRDDAARATAIGVHDRSFLVEAGAGSGKTAVMAGRIAALLAAGAAPRSIAAVTFTELAASELLIRVREFVETLRAGEIPREMRTAFPEGLDAAGRTNLASAAETIDEIVCTTIHGFCQRLVTPFPAEADIDAGASVLDPAEADLLFEDTLESWLREALDGTPDSLLAELALTDPENTIKAYRLVAEPLRKRRRLEVTAPDRVAPRVQAFLDAVGAFRRLLDGVPFVEEETLEILACFERMVAACRTLDPDESAHDLARLFFIEIESDLTTTKGAFLKYRGRKGKWQAAAARVGFAKAEGETQNNLATEAYAACCETWTALAGATGARVLAALVETLAPVVDKFQMAKRAAAAMDFDDLIIATRDLLRDHEPVRRALGQRYLHVLVDEFQDTDPIQTEIFWRLCGDPAEAGEVEAPPDWRAFRIRPGALFLVGDPKQAIYRFRGADVEAYLEARALLVAQDPDSLLSIATNFRSCSPILDWVNGRFEEPLGRPGQPGFIALDPFRPDPGDGPCVAALDVPIPSSGERGPGASVVRQSEAEMVAEYCERMIAGGTVIDRKTGERRRCRPGDIALLAPTGTDLWRYEAALEDRGVPVATQAGKGFFRRQEIQDLIAVARVLADPRDSLALGALLRGPLVGLTDEALLDIVADLPREDGSLPRLSISVDAAAVANPVARDIIEKLQSLRRRISSTTPFQLLATAVDVLRVRPILIARHDGHGERALANVDLFLGMARPYAVRGLHAFVEAMSEAWSEGDSQEEGRPDADEEAVSLVTMHKAKGLEWPIVIPINAMTELREPAEVIVDRTGQVFMNLLGRNMEGRKEALAVERAELERERARLWYVATTRAREKLVLPRVDAPPRSKTWLSIIDFDLASLPAVPLGRMPVGVAVGGMLAGNQQTREIFAEEAARIHDMRREIRWRTPSREEGGEQPQHDGVLGADGEEAAPAPLAGIAGGRARGAVLHKLIEEILTGETAESVAALENRAAELIAMTGKDAVGDPSLGLCAAEIAATTQRALRIPEIAAVRDRLVPEASVYAFDQRDDSDEAIFGIADALAVGPDGFVEVVVDWKSDVDTSPAAIENYRAQVGAYLAATGAMRGFVVLATPGRVVEVDARP